MGDWMLNILGLVAVWTSAIILLVLVVLTVDFITDAIRAIRSQPRLASHRRKE